MSIRWKNGRPIVEVYDPQTKSKKHVKARDYGMEMPKTERQAKALERAALNAREQRGTGADETCDSFTARWTRDFPRGESTNLHNHERVSVFGEEFAGRLLRSVTREEGRALGRRYPARVPALRAMYTDAKGEGLADFNPFAGLGLSGGDGRKHITVLTRDEIDKLAAIALDAHGELWGAEFASMILWNAYTMMRPGETFAARYSRLDGDTYSVDRQFNALLRRESQPKHDSTGLIYVPDEAREAVLGKPRRLNDDLMFRTKMGKQFRAGALHHAWAIVRSIFVRELPATHHLQERLVVDPKDNLDFYELRHFGASWMLHELELEPWIIAQQLRHTDGGALVTRLYGHPDRQKAIERIRRATGENVRQFSVAKGDSQGIAAGGGL